MACGQKKQNTQEGGVHLTERTCSPYNPIIKQMVDDCLGVPIYLISSIDAIINEDGKTLRQLLEEIQVGVNEGSSDLQETIEQIQALIRDLDATYATDAELLGLKGELAGQITELSESLGELKGKLLAVYNLAQYNTTNDYENETYNRVSYPTIVAAVKKLQDDVAVLSQGEYPEVELVENLRDLLLAIANFDEDSSFTQDKWENLGIEPEQGGKLKIIYKILDLIQDIGNLNGDITNLKVIINGNTTDTNSQAYKGSILGRLEYVINQINQLWAWTNDNDFAHLETYSDGNAYVKKLAVDEYPVTSAMFATDFETFKNYISIITSNTNTNKTYYLYIVPGITIGYEKQDLQWDFNDNGYIDLGDVAILATTITQNKVQNIPLRFDVNGDDEVNLSDVGDLIDYILDEDYGNNAVVAPEDWGKHIYEIRLRKTQFNAGSNEQEGTEYRGPFKQFFEGPNDNFVIIEHSLIPGKVYVDTNTTQTYRYNETTSGRPTMIKVMDLEALGVPQNDPDMLYLPINPNPSQDAELVVNNPTGVNYNNQKSYNISISEENFPVNLIAYPYPDDESQLEEGKYYINTQPSGLLTVCTFNIANDIPTVSGEDSQYTPTFTVYCITATVDVLLKNASSKESLNILNDQIYNLATSLKMRRKETNDQTKINMIDSIIGQINAVLGDTAELRSVDAIHSWSEMQYNLNQDRIRATIYGSEENPNAGKYVYWIENEIVQQMPLDDYLAAGNSYEDVVLQVFDCNKDKRVNIDDLTAIVDGLLGSDSDLYKYNYSEDSGISLLYKKVGNSIKQVVDKSKLSEFDDLNNYIGIKTENRLVRLIGGESNKEWWRFSGNTLKPIVPNISLHYDEESKRITLYTGSVPTGDISLATDNIVPDSPLDVDIIRDPGTHNETADPFVFGVYDHTASPHPYQDENGDIIPGTEFILTREELLNQTAPTLEENQYSYLSDTTGYSLMTNPQATPLVVQCEELVDNLAKKCLRTPTNVSQHFDEQLPGYTIYVKTINTVQKVFDFKEDGTMFTQNPQIYDITKQIHISFNHAAYMQDQMLLQPNNSINIKDYFTYTASITFTNVSSVVADKEYSFPKYGITLTFKECESSLDLDDMWLKVYVKQTGYIEFLETSNNFITLNPSTFVRIEDVGSSLTLNVSHFLEIPGHEALTLKGKFLSNQDDLSIQLISVPGKTITMDPNNPTLQADTWYEYTINDLKCTIR